MKDWGVYCGNLVEDKVGESGEHVAERVRLGLGEVGAADLRVGGGGADGVCGGAERLGVRLDLEAVLGSPGG